MSDRWRGSRRRRVVLGVAAAVLLALAAAAVYVLAVDRAARDVRGSDTVEFVRTDVPEPAVSRPAAPAPPAPSPSTSRWL